MKILIINTVHTEKNGITNVIFNYIKAIKDSSIVFDLVAINDIDAVYNDVIKRTGGSVYTIQRNNVPRYFINLIRKIKKNKYDIVHIHGNSRTLILELLASIIGGCKVRIIHAHSTNCLSVQLHKALRLPFNLLCTHRLACSQEAGRFMYGETPFTVINNGIDIHKYVFSLSKRNKIRTLLNVGDDEILLGHVGYFLELKNQKFIVEVLEKLNSIEGKYKLLLIGDGELRPTVEKQVKDLGLDKYVLFTGNVNNVCDYLNAMDIVVMPSLFEGLPLTLVEQQANGLSCVVSDTITREADMTGNLVFLPLKEGPLKWANIIIKMKTDYDRVGKSQRSVESIIKAGYSIEEEALKLAKYYKQAIG